MRRKKPQLNFASDRQKKRKRLRAFITAFVIFVVLLGGASLFLFLNSIDYDLKNLTGKGQEEVTEPEEVTEKVLPQIPVEDKTILLTFYTEKDELTGLYLITSHAQTENITVEAVDVNTQVTIEKTATLREHFKNGGMSGLKIAVETHTNKKMDRYIKQSETALKKIVGKVGNVTVNVPSSIHYKGKDFSLFLEQGEQNLTGDLFLKYLYYADSKNREEAVCALTKTTLEALLKNSDQTLINFLFNESDTDFSIMDASDGGMISMLIMLRSSVVPA